MLTRTQFFFLRLIHYKREKLLINSIRLCTRFKIFLFQRILRVNSGIKYSVNYTSKVSRNLEGLIIENNSIPVLASLAVSGGCYTGIHRGTVLTIKEDTIFAPNVCINTGSHDFFDRSQHTLGDIIIGKNCWLAFGVTVTLGVILGDNVTVGANSVVTKSFKSNFVIGGVPAKELKKF